MRAASALAIAAVAAVALAGCTAGDGDESSDSSDAEGTLRVITPVFPANNVGQRAFDDVVEKFNEVYPNVTVEPDFATYGNLSQKLTTGIASGQSYDVVMAGFAWVPPLAKLGVFEPLSETVFTEEAILADIGEDSSVFLEPVRYQDEIYAVPLIAQPRLMAYSKSAFEAAGLDPDQPPTSLEEVREYAQLLTIRDEDGNITQTGFDFWTTAGNYRQGLFTALGALGEPLYTDGDVPNWNTPQGVEALEWMTGIFQDGSADFGYSNASQIPLVQIGEAAMGFMGPYVNCSDAGITQEKCDDLVFTSLTDTDEAIFTGGALVGVGAGSEMKDAALAFIEALRDQESLEDIAALSNGIPLKPGDATDEFVSTNPASVFAVANLGDSVFEGGPDNWLDVRASFGPALDEALLGRTSAEDALAGIEAVALDQ